MTQGLNFSRIEKRMSNLNDSFHPPSVGAFAPHRECVPCLLRQTREAIALSTMDGGSDAGLLRAVQDFLAGADLTLSPPALAQRVQRLIRQQTGNLDPYAAVKQRLNERAAALYPEWHRRFLNTYPPFEAAVRLAIVGNLLDVGAKTQLSDDAFLAALETALTQPLLGSLADFAEATRKARHILYLADNAGEIVFDRDLLAQLSLGNFTVVVRGAPVLNDATLADAEWAGLAEFCEIITNGSDAPGTLLEDCSPEFRARFAAADLVIAKGQGNYETLAGVDKRIFFLLKVKCPVVAEALGCPCGSLVLHQQAPVRRAQVVCAN
jgi:damage-control phosphatase, subfamily I